MSEAQLRWDELMSEKEDLHAEIRECENRLGDMKEVESKLVIDILELERELEDMKEHLDSVDKKISLMEKAARSS